MFTSDHYNTVVAPMRQCFLDRSKIAFLFTHEKQVM